MIRRPQSSAPTRLFDASPLADLQEDLQESDATLARALQRLDDSRLLPWWTRPAAWWLSAPLAIGAFVLTVWGLGLVAFVGLAPALIVSGLVLVARAVPGGTDDDESRRAAATFSAEERGCGGAPRPWHRLTPVNRSQEGDPPCRVPTPSSQWAGSLPPARRGRPPTD